MSAQCVCVSVSDKNLDGLLEFMYIFAMYICKSARLYLYVHVYMKSNDVQHVFTDVHIHVHLLSLSTQKIICIE